MAGVSALFSFDAEPLTSLVSQAAVRPDDGSFARSASLPNSRPVGRRPNASQQAYLESFEGEGGLPVPLSDPQWYFSSQPALGTRLASRFGRTVFDLDRAATLAWQSNGLDADAQAVRYRIDQIDTAVAQSAVPALPVPSRCCG